MKYPMIPKRMATHTSKAKKRMLYVPMSEQITIIGPKTGNGMMAMRAHMPTGGRSQARGPHCEVEGRPIGGEHCSEDFPCRR